MDYKKRRSVFMLTVFLIVIGTVVWSIFVSFFKKESEVFLMVLLVSFANMGFGYYIIRGSYMIREVLPKKRIEFFLTAVSIVAVVTSFIQLDLHVFAKMEKDTEEERVIIDAWNIIKWQFYLYKANLSFWFIRYIFVMKNRASQ